MTDITELAQSHELLIANGQQTADLLRHLADNEIDSDYFAVVSECESYGQETDAELSITEFALRAAVYVDELVDALEKAQQVGEELCKLLPPGAEYMDPPDGGDVTPLEGVRRMVADYRQRIAELESRTVKMPHRNLGTLNYSFFARSLTTTQRIWRRLWPPLASRWRLSDA